MTEIETEPRIAGWDVRAYLDEFFAAVQPDIRFTLEFVADTLRRFPPFPLALDFGCGPTVFASFPLVPHVDDIHVADYLPANGAAVTDWLAAVEGAHDWRPFARETLRLEGNASPTGVEVAAREQATRAKTTRVLLCDAAKPDPMGPERRGLYPLVTSHCCAEGATSDRATWRTYMANIAGLVRPGGVFLVSAAEGSDAYPLGEQIYPTANVRAADLLSFFVDHGFSQIDLRVRQVPERLQQGFGAILLISGVKAGE